jgi:hypothetical protein
MARGQAAAERGESATNNALLAARTAPCLNWFWYLRGLWTEARGWLSSLARLTDLPSNVECRLLGGESRFAVEQGDLAAATGLIGRSLAVAERAGDRATAAVAIGLQGLFLTRTGAPAAVARERSERALELTRTIEPAEFLAAMQPELGWWIGMQHQARCQRALFDGDLAEATDAGREALRAMRSLGEPLGTALALGSMALLGMRAGDLTGARTLLDEALALAHQGLPPPIAADVLGHLATVTRLSGDSAGAREMLGQSLTLRRDHGLRLGAANDMVALAAVELPGDPTAAATLLAASEAIVAAVAARRRPVEQLEFAQCQRKAQKALDEAAFGVASSAGADMTYEDALRYALKRTTGRPTSHDRIPAEAGGH